MAVGVIVLLKRRTALVDLLLFHGVPVAVSWYDVVPGACRGQCIGI